MQSPSDKLGFGPMYKDATLSNLDIDSDILEKVSEWLKNPRYILLLTGTPGTGKTHLLAAIINDKWGKYEENKELRYFRDDKLYRESKLVIQQHNWDPASEMLRKCSCKYLVIDDFGVITSDYKINCWEEIIDYRLSYGEKNPTIITTNLTEEQIFETHSPRFHDRLFSDLNTIVKFPLGSFRRTVKE